MVGLRFIIICFLFVLPCLGQQTYHLLDIIPNTSGASGELHFVETNGWTSGTGIHYVGFKAPPAIPANKIWTLPSADGSANQPLCTDGALGLIWCSAGGGAGSPGGTDTEIQFNLSGAFGADSALTFNYTDKRLLVGPAPPTTERLNVDGSIALTNNSSLKWKDSAGTPLILALFDSGNELHIGPAFSNLPSGGGLYLYANGASGSPADLKLHWIGSNSGAFAPVDDDVITLGSTSVSGLGPFTDIFTYELNLRDPGGVSDRSEMSFWDDDNTGALRFLGPEDVSVGLIGLVLPGELPSVGDALTIGADLGSNTFQLIWGAGGGGSCGGNFACLSSENVFTNAPQTIKTTTEHSQFKMITEWAVSGAVAAMSAYTFSGAAGNRSDGFLFDGLAAHGTEASTTITKDADNFLRFRSNGWDGSGWQLGSVFGTAALGDWSGSNRGAYWYFQTVAQGSTTLSDRVTIGRYAPLHVIGGIAGSGITDALRIQYGGSVGDGGGIVFGNTTSAVGARIAAHSTSGSTVALEFTAFNGSQMILGSNGVLSAPSNVIANSGGHFIANGGGFQTASTGGTVAHTLTVGPTANRTQLLNSVGNVAQEWNSQTGVTTIGSSGSPMQLTIYGAALPDANATRNLGGSGFRWDTIWGDELNLNTGISTDITAHSLRPASNNTYELGAFGSAIWQSVYAGGFLAGSNSSITGSIRFYNSAVSGFSQLRSATVSGSVDLEVNRPFYPSATTSLDLGASSRRWNKTWTKDLDASGAITAAGAISATAGLATNNGTNSTLYVGSGGNFYNRVLGGASTAISCSGVTDGWTAIATDNYVVVCRGATRYRAALVAF